MFSYYVSLSRTIILPRLLRLLPRLPQAATPTLLYYYLLPQEAVNAKNRHPEGSQETGCDQKHEEAPATLKGRAPLSAFASFCIGARARAPL